MTRENKLALVIGFGLILFVGILVSDHFSAQRYDGAQLTRASATSEGSGVDLTPIETPVAIHSPTTGETIELITRAEPVTVVDGGAQGGASAVEPLPITIAQGDEGEGEPVRFYKVQPGDTLWKIAAREYGDGSLNKELADYNKSVLSDGGRLALNQQLRLPSLKKLRPTRMAITESAVAAASPETTTKKTETGRTHTIAKGDTVYRLAQRYSVKPQAIMAANGIRDAGSLQLGQSIKIPSARSSY
ncbi:MAG: LysM peptidoglycan-binding domain-containing protein [Phycisphaerae bacterium]|nr:LysM peptidoglycan-binding domain-containing protein [Phycisphaerae bacterium]